MNELEGFVLEGGRGLYRPVGSVSFDELVALIRAAIAAARSNQVRDLLVDTTALTGFPFARHISAVLGGRGVGGGGEGRATRSSGGASFSRAKTPLNLLPLTSQAPSPRPRKTPMRAWHEDRSRR